MQSITDQGRVSRGARLGKIGTFAGLGLLVGGLIISLMLQESSLLLVAFGLLLLGILTSSIGTLNMNRWVREPRADQALERGLKGYDDRYRLYNYHLPAPHVLLCPIGLYVLTVKGQDGVIRYEGDRFRRSFSVGRLFRFMGEEGLGRPFADADGQVQALQRFLDEHDAGDGVEIQSIVVFYNPRVDLQVTDAPRPVVDPKGLKRAIRRTQDQKLSSAEYRKLQQLLDATAG